MTVLLQVLNSVPTKSTVPETVFGAIGSQANALEGNFQAYMEAFKPFLFNALGNEEDPSLCSMAVGLVGDIVRALGDKAQPYCDNFMNYLMNALQGSALGNTFRPAILQTFGDIAQAIGGHYETYLAVASQVLKQAAASTLDLERGSAGYLISLREGIMDAWDGAILAMKHSGKGEFDWFEIRFCPKRLLMPL